MKKLVLPAAVLAACLLALVVTPSTEAAVADPISPTNWNTSPSGGCSVFRVIIGDCALPPDAFKPDSGGQTLDPVDTATLDSIETASEVLPALSTISALGTISLGVGAFTVGWHIGNSLNNKWLHLDGAGLGTSSGDPGTGAIVTSPEWFLRSTTGAYATPAWAAMEKYSCNGQNYGLILTASFNIAPGTPEACYSAAKKNFEASNGSKGKWVYVSTQYGSVGQKLYDSYAWVIDASAMPKLGLVQDEPMQPYTGQTTTLSTGWANPATGAGVTSTAPSYGSSNAPAPCFYDLSTNAPVCTGAAPTSSYSIEGLLTNGDPNFSDPGTNLVRGMMSPGSFAPAAPAGDGNWATTGGPLITIPDCHGLTVADCEAAVDSVIGLSGASFDAGFPMSVAATYDPDLPDGTVIATNPDAGASSDPSVVELQLNESDPSSLCNSHTDYPHYSDNTAGVGPGMLVKGRVMCPFDGTVDATVDLWTCTVRPSEKSVDALNADPNCTRIASQTKTVAVATGVWSENIVSASGQSEDTSAWYIGLTYGTDIIASPSELIEPQ